MMNKSFTYFKDISEISSYKRLLEQYDSKNHIQMYLHFVLGSQLFLSTAPATLQHWTKAY